MDVSAFRNLWTRSGVFEVLKIRRTFKQVEFGDFIASRHKSPKYRNSLRDLLCIMFSTEFAEVIRQYSKGFPGYSRFNKTNKSKPSGYCLKYSKHSVMSVNLKIPCTLILN